MRRIVTALALAAAPLLTAGAAWAHHSVAAYDFTKVVQLEGTVRSFQWSNPHSYIQLDVLGPDKKVHTWSIEAGVPAGMIRMGWTPQTL